MYIIVEDSIHLNTKPTLHSSFRVLFVVGPLPCRFVPVLASRTNWFSFKAPLSNARCRRPAATNSHKRAAGAFLNHTESQYDDNFRLCVPLKVHVVCCCSAPAIESHQCRRSWGSTSQVSFCTTQATALRHFYRNV